MTDAAGAAVDAVLLDLDGVLVDSRVPFTRCVNAALLAHGMPARPERDLYRFIGPPLHATFAELTGDPALVAACVETYRARYRLLAAAETPLMPGIGRAVEVLARALPLVVATSKPRALAEPLLRALGLRERFRAVVGPSLALESESKSETVGRALEHVPGARRVAMVGDRRFDMRAAREHGLFGIGVLWGIGDAGELLDAGADRLVADPDELVAVLLADAGPG